MKNRSIYTKFTNICTTSSPADPQMRRNLNARAQGALVRCTVRIVSRLGEPNGTAPLRLRPRKKNREVNGTLFYKLASPQAAQLMTIFK